MQFDVTISRIYACRWDFLHSFLDFWAKSAIAMPTHRTSVVNTLQREGENQGTTIDLHPARGLTFLYTITKDGKV